MKDCIFCKIINKEIESKIEYEDEHCIVFHDINPQKKIHLLIVPKKHIPTIKDVKDEDEKILGRMLNVAKKMGEKFNLEDYKLIMNVGEKSGQVIFHIHLHLLSMPT